MVTINVKSISIKNKDKNSYDSEAETELIELGEWAIISLRIPGYFPMNIRVSESKSSLIQGQKQNLHSSKKSKYLEGYGIDYNLLLISIWCLAGLIVGCYCTIRGYEAVHEFGKDTRVFSEKGNQLIYTYNGIILTCVATLFRLVSLIRYKNILKFWKHTVNLIKEFDKFGIFKEDLNFQKIKQEVKKQAIVSWIIIAFQSVCTFIPAYFLRTHVLFENDIMQTMLWILAILVMDFHIGLLIWWCFFIKLYRSCFQSISTEIDSLMKNSSSKQSQEWIKVGPSLIFGGDFFKNQRTVCGFDNENKNDSEVAEKLLKLLDLYEQTCEEIERFSKFYGVPMLIEILVCISSLQACIYSVNKFMYEVGDHSWVLNFFVAMKLPPHLVYMIRLFFLTDQSGYVTEEGLRVLRSLQRVGVNVLGHLQLQAKVQMLVTRVAMNPPGISPCNFLTLNRKLLASIISLLVTYYFILISFREEDEGRKIIRSLNLSCTKLKM